MLFNRLFFLLASVSAHPGESHEVSDEVHLARRNFVQYVKREGGNCNALARRSEHVAENHRAKIAQLRQEIQAKKKKRESSDDDASRYASIDHESSRTNITADIPLSDLFTDDDATCLLQPESTNGPYYVTGEFIRDDITDDQEGVPLYVSVELFDTTNCQALPEIYWEIWHCNALGIYSGVQASTNGGGNDYFNETFLRGIAESDENGAVMMKTIFPGHYTGRATHIHVMAHQNVTVYENGTIGSGEAASGTILHVGQLFFDQDLISEVEAVAPYTDNTQELTENLNDNILGGESAADAPDPFFKYVKLGDDINDGIYAWVAIGIDSTASRSANPAAYYDAEGGHSTGDQSGPGGSGGPPDGSGGPGGSGAPSGRPGGASGAPSGAPSGSEAPSGSDTPISTSSESEPPSSAANGSNGSDGVGNDGADGVGNDGADGAGADGADADGANGNYQATDTSSGTISFDSVIDPAFGVTVTTGSGPGDAGQTTCGSHKPGHKREDGASASSGATAAVSSSGAQRQNPSVWGLLVLGLGSFLAIYM